MSTAFMNFLVYEFQELVILANEYETTKCNEIFTWLKPHITYRHLETENNFASFEEILENIVDRIYLVLNIIFLKLEELTESHNPQVKRPRRFTIATLGRIIINQLNNFHLSKDNKKSKYIKDQESQTLPTVEETNSFECTSCLILFRSLNSITNSFDESGVNWTQIAAAKENVRSKLFEVDNSKSMQMMCDAIKKDLNVFVTKDKQLQRNHENLTIKYDKLTQDFLVHIKECDQNSTQNEEDYKELLMKVDTLNKTYLKKLQLVDESHSKFADRVGRFIDETHLELIEQEKSEQSNQLLTCTLQTIAQQVHTFDTLINLQLQKINTAFEVCNGKVSLLELHQHQRDESTSPKNKKVITQIPNPSEDMIKHVENNKRKITRLQDENAILLRTVNKIKTFKC